MTLDNLIYAVIAAVIGVMAAMLSAMIKRRKKDKKYKIDEKAIKTHIEKIVTELNIDNAHFYILNTNKKFTAEKEMEFRFKSKGGHGGGAHIYQVKGSAGRVGIFVSSHKAEGIGVSLSEVSKYF